jgi:hypothetical protein
MEVLMFAIWRNGGAGMHADDKNLTKSDPMDNCLLCEVFSQRDI